MKNYNIEEILSLKSETGRPSGTVFDTFSALCKIASYDKNLLEGEPLGKVSALLISLESKPGGPYYSDFPGKNIKRRIDRPTNECIYHFLKLYDIHLPGLHKFLQKGKTKDIKKENNEKRILTSSEASMIKRIEKELGLRLSGFPSEFKELAFSVARKTVAGNPDMQMSLMPYYAKKAFGKKAEKIPDKTVVSMGLANVFFWTSFIIYDDFWDEDEAADPRLLPIANLFARSYVDFLFLCLIRKANTGHFSTGLWMTWTRPMLGKLQGAGRKSRII